MSERQSYRESHSLDLPFGLLLGLLGGVLTGILFAPKPGRELQEDVQGFVNHFPEKLQEQCSRSKVRCHDIVGKTKSSIERKLEQRSHKKQAVRMAEAKQREEKAAGVYEY